eukprot:gnl/TRDRNA2_/TRDRNA2_136228_c2_seq1.p1 gnl/TRDRNA2_/TRDRNA2_136228_c2~~gnl/TRDRNA2_/TRDRNA2_136228_c2_seq1.p1  ORF type:complete len:232 (+),score=56.07 gnl/TRDRNA2_/TRDRNA2_136228_c2_seq1:162-857(+)
MSSSSPPSTTAVTVEELRSRLSAAAADEEAEPEAAAKLLDVLEAYHPSQLIAWLQRRLVVVEEVPDLPVTSEAEDPYAVLQVAADADDADIRRAYRRLALATHPDKATGDPKRFQDVARAYATLNDPAQRAACDRERERASLEIVARPRRPPRMRLRPSQEVADEMAKDLENAGGAIGEALEQLWGTLWRSARDTAAAAATQPYTPEARDDGESTLSDKAAPPLGGVADFL